MKITAGQRLTAAVALVVLAISVAGLGAQYLLVKRDLEERQRGLVAADFAGFAALYDQRRIPAVRQAIEFYKAVETAPHTSGESRDGPVLALLDRSGNVLAATHGGWPEGVAVPAEGARTEAFPYVLNDRPYMGVSQTLAGGFPLHVARSSADMNRTLASLRRIILGVVLCVAVAGLIAGHLTSRWIMARVTRINRLADRVADGDLAARLPEPRRADEFGQLESHIHDMLDRIEALQRASSHLSDTVAHEMRTPLTRIQARLARLDLQDEDAALVMQDIRDTVRIFDSLLEIARAQAAAGGQPGPERVELSDLLVELHELYEPLAEERGITFSARIDPGVCILGDRNFVALLISNLYENALKFTPAGEAVEVSLAAGQARHMMTVSDTGPGLPPGFQDTLFDRFSRAPSATDTPGHGLGLALVQAVALRHGAKLSLPPVEKGFAIQLAWPSVAETI
ncbi:HAMP domain-containing histidine kinase [Seohaeicola saemankumensis]|nr:HAMP domain-containing sensor histidine kinase [Seohaeicola saemankumensis]MCA0873773.1 HAMP domain-containing histidine kinase [Seohaeicola saemankumensis]